MPLLRSQQVWVFEKLTQDGFDPRDFDLLPDGFQCATGGIAPALIHRSSSFYFAFRTGEHGGYFVEFSPGSEKAIDTYGTSDWLNAVVVPFTPWLGYLRREIEAPDLWGELRREAALVAGSPAGASNTPFTADEQAAIRRSLSEAKQLARANPGLTQAQFSEIEVRLDYLAEAVSRVGRLDWRELFIGSLLGLILQSIVPPEPVRDVILLIARAVGHLFGTDLPPMLPS